MELQSIINLLKDIGQDCEDPLDTENLAELVMDRLTSDDPTEDELLEIIYQVHDDYRNSL